MMKFLKKLFHRSKEKEKPFKRFESALEKIAESIRDLRELLLRRGE